ncbi:type II restriction enzyme NspV homolog [Nostoc sp. NIES-2111]|nr:type II restriction enzyme NspV homolog [Nostoc sp. NIES-2111]
MIRNAERAKLEYGDFQTPLILAEKVCKKLCELGVNPDIIIEPTCGVGNFIQAAANSFPAANKIFGLEINSSYLDIIKQKQKFLQDSRIDSRCGDFFDFDWASLINESNKCVLVIGNFPWVTNSRQGRIDGANLPIKTNFQKHNGIDAITGKSNFDISEWMLIQVVQLLHKRNSYLAMLCKTSVARKILGCIRSQKLNLAYSATYKINSQKYFNVNVDACLFFCKFDSISHNYFCDTFDNLDTLNYCRIGYWNNILVKDLVSFEKLEKLYDSKSKLKWRSGIKHDCANIMEFRRINNTLINGLGEAVDIEETYIFPLIKGSYVAQNQTKTTDRYILVTQKFVGEPTEYIKDFAPKTWQYLEKYESFLEKRKSKIYKHNPKFSIFGVGLYTFAPWKIAICGLYKKLDFRLIGKIDDKPSVFDDTVYFLSFDEEKFAKQTYALLTSSLAKDFYSSLIFWDEKRPIKSSVLNSLNLNTLAEVADEFYS